MIIPHLPLTVNIAKRKTMKCTWNAYHKKDRRSQAKAKKDFKRIFLEKYDIRWWELPAPPLIFYYTIFPRTKKKFDLMNIGSIVDKFTADVLVDVGLIVDDNYTVIRKVVFDFGGFDRFNPRAELEILGF